MGAVLCTHYRTRHLSCIVVLRQATGNRIYVGNLAWTVEWQELKDHMRTVGKVVHADVLQDGDGRSKVRF